MRSPSSKGPWQDCVSLALPAVGLVLVLACVALAQWATWPSGAAEGDVLLGKGAFLAAEGPGFLAAEGPAIVAQPEQGRDWIPEDGSATWLPAGEVVPALRQHQQRLYSSADDATRAGQEAIRAQQASIRSAEDSTLRRQRMRPWYRKAVNLSDPNLRLYWPLHECDHCVGHNHFQFAFNCVGHEARYLWRTLVLRSTVCLHPDHNEGQWGVGPIEAYYDIKFMRRYVQWVFEDDLLQALQSQPRANVSLRVFGFRAASQELKMDPNVNIIIRDLFDSGTAYGYEICRRKHAPMRLSASFLKPATELWVIANGIRRRMAPGNYVAVHVRRGDKALDKQRWPNLDSDTQPEAILAKLKLRLPEGQQLYILSDERKEGYFDPLKAYFQVHMLEDYKDLWGPGSSWHNWSWAMFNETPFLDVRMKVIIDYTLFISAKGKIDTFYGLTKDPREGYT